MVLMVLASIAVDLSAIRLGRQELDSAPVLGVLLVRLENWGLVSHILRWEELIKIQDGLSRAALEMKGRGLRQLDLPVDPGLAGEGFTVILSAPRTASW